MRVYIQTKIMNLTRAFVKMAGKFGLIPQLR